MAGKFLLAANKKKNGRRQMWKKEKTAVMIITDRTDGKARKEFSVLLMPNIEEIHFSFEEIFFRVPDASE